MSTLEKGVFALLITYQVVLNCMDYSAQSLVTQQDTLSAHEHCLCYLCMYFGIQIDWVCITYYLAQHNYLYFIVFYL